MNNILKYSIILFALWSILLWKLKPGLMFQEDQTLREFGMGTGKTILSFPVALLFSAIIIYWICQQIANHQTRY